MLGDVVVGGELRPGIILYGLVPPHVGVDLGNDPSAGLGSSWSQHRLVGDAWAVDLWDIAIDRPPPAGGWQPVLEPLLGRVIESGARVAWFGSEGLPFAEPPELFHPGGMTGGVLAAMTSDRNVIWTADGFGPISDLDLLRLRAHGAGLADVG